MALIVATAVLEAIVIPSKTPCDLLLCCAASTSRQHRIWLPELVRAAVLLQQHSLAGDLQVKGELNVTLEQQMALCHASWHSAPGGSAAQACVGSCATPCRGANLPKIHAQSTSQCKPASGVADDSVAVQACIGCGRG